MYNAQVPKDKITLWAIDALSVRERTPTTLKSIIKHVSGLVSFYLETRKEAKCELTGEHSVALPRDYLESLAERGRTSPASAKHALTVWPDALNIDWPPSHAIVTSAASAESNEPAKQAPAMSLATGAQSRESP